MDAQLTEIIEAQKQTDTAKDGLREKLEALQAKITQGEYSTGDTLQDFLIVTGGILEKDETYQKLENFANLVKENRGEQILLCKESYRQTQEAGCFSGARFDIDRRIFKLGVIDGEVEYNYAAQISVDLFPHTAPALSIPMQKHATLKDSMYGEWEEAEGSFKVGLLDIHQAKNYFEGEGFTNTNHGTYGPQTFILLVGENIDLCFYRFENSLGNMDMLEQALKSEKYAARQREMIHPNTKYSGGLRALGLDVPEAFQIQEDRNSKERKLALYQEIRDLPKDSQDLKAKLEYAQKVELHEFDHDIEPEPGITINVGKYISGLFEKEGIKKEEKEN